MRENGANTNIQQCRTGLLCFVVDSLHSPNDAGYRILQNMGSIKSWKVTTGTDLNVRHCLCEL